MSRNETAKLASEDAIEPMEVHHLLSTNLRHDRLHCSSWLLATALYLTAAPVGAQQGSGQNDMDAAFSAPPQVTTTRSTSNSTPVKPLTGVIQRNTGLRIDRTKPNDYKPLDGAAFAQPPVTSPPIAGATQQLAGEAAKEAPKKGKHIWHQSLAGGYYDATGAIPGVIPGDELYKYGGVFQDGLPVPTTPVAMNFAKHCYRFPFVPKPFPERR